MVAAAVVRRAPAETGMTARCVAVAALLVAGCADDASTVVASTDTSGTSSDASTGTSSSASTGGSSSTTEGGGTSTTADEPTCAGAWSSRPHSHTASWVAAAPDLDVPFGLACAPGGDFVLLHRSREADSQADPDVVTVRYDVDGEVRWTDAYAGSMGLEDVPLAAAVDALGRPYALVREHLAEVHASGWTFIDSRIVVLAFDEAGGHRWRWELPSDPANPDWPNDARHAALAIDGDLHLHVAATSDYQVTDPTELVLVELDPWGNVLAQETLVGDAPWGVDPLRYALAPDGSPRVMVEADVAALPGARIYARGDDGELVEVASFGGDRYRPEALAVGPAAELVVGGYAYPLTGHRGFLRGFASDGTESFAIDGTPLPEHVGAVAIDCDGTIVIAGTNGDRAEVGAFDPEGTWLWSADLEPTVAVSSAEAWNVALAPDASALVAAGYLDLVADDPGRAPWFAVFVPQ